MRRRKSRGTWFPTIGTQVNILTDEVVAGRAFAITLPANSDVSVTITTPLTFDQPQEGDNLVQAETRLSSIIGSDYILKRILGKIFISRISGGTDVSVVDENPAVLVGAGFFVARANDQSVGGGAETPIGSATAAERRDHYSVLDTDTIREPWIWRRTWVLGLSGSNNLANDARGVGALVGTAGNDAGNYPASTALYGSVMDGPHIDAKSRRRVCSDDRLFFAISVIPFPVGETTRTVESLAIDGYLDYRLFGTLIRSRNNGNF